MLMNDEVITLTKKDRQLAIKEIMELKRKREECEDYSFRKHYSLFDKIAKDFEFNGNLEYF